MIKLLFLFFIATMFFENLVLLWLKKLLIHLLPFPTRLLSALYLIDFLIVIIINIPSRCCILLLLTNSRQNLRSKQENKQKINATKNYYITKALLIWISISSCFFFGRPICCSVCHDSDLRRTASCSLNPGIIRPSWLFVVGKLFCGVWWSLSNCCCPCPQH